MEISEIQSQLAFNRKAIHELHEEEKYVKRCAQSYYEKQYLAAGDNMMKILTNTKNRIAKLVILQKALKQDLEIEYQYDKIFREENYYESN